jgi:hypothetical protein
VRDWPRLASTVHPLGYHWPVTGQATGDVLYVYWPLLCCTSLDCEVIVHPLGATTPGVPGALKGCMCQTQRRNTHHRTRAARAARATDCYYTRAGAESAARCALRATKSERARLGWPGHRSAPRPRQLQLRRPAQSAAPPPSRWRIFRDDGALCARAERAPVRGSRPLALCRRPSRRARCAALAETSRAPLGCCDARAGLDGAPGGVACQEIDPGLNSSPNSG